ncbi:hypothetical protein JOE11_001358 [Robbsia andropogonis]
MHGLDVTTGGMASSTVVTWSADVGARVGEIPWLLV